MQPGLEAMAGFWLEGKDNTQSFTFLVEASKGCGAPHAAWGLFAGQGAGMWVSEPD